MYRNGINKDNKTFDAIVVGSGISGGWAVKELCDSGVKHSSWKEVVRLNIPKITLLRHSIPGKSRTQDGFRKRRRRKTPS